MSILYGSEIERFILGLMRFQYLKAYLSKDELGTLVIPEIGETWEIKRTEKKYIETGKVFVEIEFEGKPSGISVSTADYWVFVVGGIGYRISLEILRWLIFNSKNLKIVGSNDEMVPRGYLYPIKELFPFAETLDFDKMGKQYDLTFPYD